MNAFRLCPAAGRNDCLCQAPGITETARPVDDLGGLMSIDQRFRDDKARSKRANLRFGRDVHTSLVPFLKRARDTEHRQPNNAS